jgi:hypothetical protein
MCRATPAGKNTQENSAAKYMGFCACESVFPMKEKRRKYAKIAGTERNSLPKHREWPTPVTPRPSLNPFARGIEPLFRTPVRVNTKTDEFFVGYYAR